MTQVMTYNHQLACEGAEYLGKAWNTTLLVPCDMSGSMTNLMLPPDWSSAAISYASSTLLSEYNAMVVFAAVLSEGTQGTPINFLRLSAQVYVSMDDVRWLAEVVPKLVAEYVAQGPGAATSQGQGPL